MRLWVVAWAWLVTVCNAQLAWPQEEGRHCSWTVSHGMKGLLCSGLNLKEVPPSLSSSIELLDLSSNRLRSLGADSLSRYSYLRYLYLNDNLLVAVDDDAFSSLQLLEAVDLSLNALHRVPSSLLSLPALRRLYLADNPLLGLSSSTGLDLSPPPPELHFLTIAGCSLTVLPSFQGWRKLHTLNVSGNLLGEVTTTQVAPLCSLTELDLRDNPPLFRRQEQLCNCTLLGRWLANKKVQLARGYSLPCAGDADEVSQECQETEDDQLQYEACSEQLVALEQSAKTRKTLSTAGICVGVVVGVALVTLLAWLKCRRRRRVARQDAPIHNHKPLLHRPSSAAAETEAPVETHAGPEEPAPSSSS